MSKSDVELPHSVGLEIAMQLLASLSEHTKNSALLGSIARERPLVHDIDILVMPRTVDDIAWIKDIFSQSGRWIRGGTRLMCIIDTLDVAGLKTDLFVCHPPAQWGVILTTHISPDALNEYAKERLLERGYKYQHSHLVDSWSGEPIAVPDEQTWFELAGLTYVEPRERENYTRSLGLEVESDLR